MSVSFRNLTDGTPSSSQQYQRRSGMFHYAIPAPTREPVDDADGALSIPRLSPLPDVHLEPQERVIRFTNCRIIRNHTLSKEDLWIQHGKIVDPRVRFWDAQKLREYAADEIVDCHGLILAPGFIDLQLNGGFGFDFTSPADDLTPPVSPFNKDNNTTHAPNSTLAESKNSDSNGANSSSKQPPLDSARIAAGIDLVSTGILKYGVTSYCVTVITSSPTTYASLLRYYAPRRGSRTVGATILGIHCEGPFISKPGAHCVPLMQTKDIQQDSLIQMYGRDNLPYIRVITLAPEIPNMLSAIEYLHTHHPSIVISSGHSSADYDTALAATEKGVTLLTHLFNAMIPFTHRDPGIAGLIGCHDPAVLQRLFYSIIADGIHTHAASIRIAYQTHPTGIILITDAMAAMGLGAGHTYHLGSTHVRIIQQQDGQLKAIVANTENTLAGSIATMDQCVRRFAEMCGCGIVAAIEAATLHPAQCLGLQHKGRLDVGCDADLVLLDDQLNVQGVWIDGEMAWVKDKAVRIIAP